MAKINLYFSGTVFHSGMCYLNIHNVKMKVQDLKTLIQVHILLTDSTVKIKGCNESKNVHIPPPRAAILDSSMLIFDDSFSLKLRLLFIILPILQNA